MLFVYIIPPFTAALFVIRVICTFSCLRFFLVCLLARSFRMRIQLHWFDSIACCFCWWCPMKNEKRQQFRIAPVNGKTVQNEQATRLQPKKPKSILRTLSFTFGGNFRHFSWITRHFRNYQLHGDAFFSIAIR